MPAVAAHQPQARVTVAPRAARREGLQGGALVEQGLDRQLGASGIQGAPRTPSAGAALPMGVRLRQAVEGLRNATLHQTSFDRAAEASAPKARPIPAWADGPGHGPAHARGLKALCARSDRDLGQRPRSSG